jgi:hypothetical protein
LCKSYKICIRKITNISTFELNQKLELTSEKTARLVLMLCVVRSLTDLIRYTEMLVAAFNDEVDRKPEEKMDLEAFRHGDSKAAMQQISDLVNMAKAHALDAVGEERAPTELVARYLEI